MKILTNRRFHWIAVSLVAILGLTFGAYALYVGGRPAPIPVKHKYFDGITYYREVSLYPHPMVAHVLVIDTKTANINLLVTPPDETTGAPLKARTTSQFMQEFGVQIAINGDGFSPWWSRNPADYYPHVGDPVTPNGYAASNGKSYSDGNEPTLYISRRNYLTFDYNPSQRPSRIYQAISGERMLVLKGESVPGLDNSTRNPRTAIGTNQNGRYLILVVVDGRQPFYSDGATFVELANLLIEHGAYVGMNMDGGGSSTMVIVGSDGKSLILNSPIDNYIPGRERPVANHLGIFVGK